VSDVQKIPGEDRSEPAPADIAAGHEVSDVNIRGLMVFLIGLVVSLVLVGVSVAWMLELLAEKAERNDPKPPALAELRDKQPPGPRLQHSPAEEMEELRRAQEARLSQMKWVDKQVNFVQIPIERAMRQIAEKGFPDWPAVKEEKKAPAEEQQ
jgi:hypothetical protein